MHPSHVQLSNCPPPIAVMAKRARGADHGFDELATHRITKSAIGHVFEAMHEKGLLDKQVTRRHIARDVAKSRRARAMTTAATRRGRPLDE